MPRDRTLPLEFWTRQAVVGCTAMSRLLLLGLMNFADNFGVLPLQLHTLRLQIFPADGLDDDQMRAMIDELVGRKLLSLYEVDGVQYVSIVDWSLWQRIPRRARRRYPRDPALPPEPVPEAAPAPAPSPPPPPATEADDEAPPEAKRWRKAIGRKLDHFMPSTGAPQDTEYWIERMRADGCDLLNDVMPAINVAMQRVPGEPPPGLGAVAAFAEANRVRRLAVDHASLSR